MNRMFSSHRLTVTMLALSVSLLMWQNATADDLPPLVRSGQGGSWFEGKTWEGGKVPGDGVRVQVRTGHMVTYDSVSDAAIRSVHVAGTLAFATDKDTRLCVGLIKIQAGDDPSENGFDCEAHLEAPDPTKPRATLQIGTPARPVDANRTALIRLIPVKGLDANSCPAIVNCGGRLDLHGAPLSRTWVKLAEAAKVGDSEILLSEKVSGRRAGDRIIVTATVRQNKIAKTFKPSTKDSTQTEERLIKAISGDKVTLDKPLEFAHVAEGEYRADVANLSRNVIVESAEPDVSRGHTMYHRHSAGAISYAELRHLGKPGVLGRYSLHFHLVGDTMRGASVVGASIWDSGNRWITIHGTNYLVVRDCVGYQSLGHGFFMEDGSEVYNVLDRNLAVQAYITKPLPKQILPFDKNDGSGFWWANCHNTFTRNVACDCDEYGYFFQAAKTADFDTKLAVQQPDGTQRDVDIRTLPFVRFEDNESHCQRRHSFNLGGGAPFGQPGVGGVGPDNAHPFVIRNMKFWNVHWGIHPHAPGVMLDGITIHQAEYGIWRPNYTRHAYRNVAIDLVPKQTQYAFEAGTRPTDAEYPKPLELVDDLPPVTVVTHVGLDRAGRFVARGTTSDNGEVTRVLVNSMPAKALRPNFAEWEISLEAAKATPLNLKAYAEDAAGNIEARPHFVPMPK